MSAPAATAGVNMNAEFTPNCPQWVVQQTVEGPFSVSLCPNQIAGAWNHCFCTSTAKYNSEIDVKITKQVLQERAKLEAARQQGVDFVALVSKYIDSQRINYTGFTLHGKVNWVQWGAPFYMWLDAKRVQPEQVKSHHLVAFFAHRAQNCHYGAYELQILLDALMAKAAMSVIASTLSILNEAMALEPNLKWAVVQRHVQNGAGFIAFCTSCRDPERMAMTLRYHNPMNESYFM